MWWQEGIDAPAPESEYSSEGNWKGPRRFWLKKDSSRQVLFCDDSCLKFHEHNLKLGGKFGNYYTCIGAKALVDDETSEIKKPACPICEAGDKPSYVGAFTVKDLTGYTTAAGEEKGKGEKQLLVAKFYTLQVLEKQWEKREGLQGVIFEVSRTSINTAPSVGNIWDFEKKIEAGQISDAKPFNYKELFAPKPIEEMKNVAQAWSGVAPASEPSSEANTGEAVQDEDYIAY